MKSLILKFDVSFFYNIFIAFLGMILSFLLISKIIENFGITVYGQYAFLVSFLGIIFSPLYLSQVRILGRSTSLLHARNEIYNLKKLYKEISYLNFYIALFISIIIYLDFNFFKFFFVKFSFSSSTIFFASLVFIVLSFNNQLFAILRGINLATLSQILDVILRPTIFLLLIVFFSNSLNQELLSIYSLMIFFLISVSLVFIFNLILIFFNFIKLKMFKYKSSSQKSPSFTYKSFVLISAIFGFQLINKNLSISLLGFMSTEYDIAIYELGNKFANIALIPFLTLCKINQYKIVKYFDLKDIDKLLYLYKSILFFSSILTLLYFFAFFIIGDYLIINFFSSELQKSSDVGLLLILANFIFISFGPASVFLLYCSKDKYILIPFLLTLCLNFISTIFLIKQFGVYGPCISAILSSLLCGFLLKRQFYKRVLY